MISYFYVNNIVVKITSLTHLTTSYCNYCHRFFHFVNVDLLRQELFWWFGYYTVVERYLVGFHSVSKR